MKKTLENTVGKGENAGNEHFLFFPTVFSTLPDREIVILAMFELWSAHAFSLFMSKILSFGKGLIKVIGIRDCLIKNYTRKNYVCKCI